MIRLFRGRTFYAEADPTGDRRWPVGYWLVCHIKPIDVRDEPFPQSITCVQEIFERDPETGQFMSKNFNELPWWADPVLAERERCAKIAEGLVNDSPRNLSNPASSGWDEAAETIATRIRSGE